MAVQLQGCESKRPACRLHDDNDTAAVSPSKSTQSPLSIFLKPHDSNSHPSVLRLGLLTHATVEGAPGD